MSAAATPAETLLTATAGAPGPDTIFTDWVTPGLVSGLMVGAFFFVMVAVGVSWLTSIQTPRNLPSANQHQQKKNQ
ncbi:hypothetical protein H4R18_001184 [Coemansia javaensis]|uniref:V-type proton ATPase subunit S1/VOA1 transmembrane domain-containing protein n=1 Tax=Coemansia javaensis TaxID=2761396 RepID=A0A9W8HM86_9FUNG|nr:hypothetical protein H4R18_001184 [Coemansia javaensis]